MILIQNTDDDCKRSKYTVEICEWNLAIYRVVFNGDDFFVITEFGKWQISESQC